MAIHDWSKIPPGLFHHFHQDWSIEIARTLNRGRLPKGVAALVEQKSGPLEPDVLAIEVNERALFGGDEGTVATMASPVTRIVRRTSNEIYARRANRIVLKHHLGRTLAIIEIISPGNKDSKASLGDFVDKVIDFLRKGVHVLVIDLFPPSPRDPFGLHKAIWDQIEEEDFDLLEGKDRVFASYMAGPEKAAYVELAGVGDPLPEMPLFFAHEFHVKVPLESTYQTAWDSSPEDLREFVLGNATPAP